MSSKSLVNRFVRNHQLFEKNCIKLTFSGCHPPIFFNHIILYIAPSSVHALLNLNLPFRLVLRRLFSDVWSENAAPIERLVEIHSNPPILYIILWLMFKNTESCY